jgi:hypothetical protein
LSGYGLLKAACRWVPATVSASNSKEKMIEKGEIAKGDAHHIERSGAHLGFQTGLRPAEVPSGVRVSAAQNLRNPSHVGLLVPTCKIGISP